MNFLKKILGIDNTSSKREVLFAEKTETTESVISADNILTYKKEGDVVYAYLNQTALDAFLYNRAKANTNNFQSDFKWRSQEGKRVVTLHDITKNDHSVYFFPIIDGEYVEKRNLVLAVGLNSLYFSVYCNENRISLYDTLLYRGVNLYSEYSGFFTNNVKDYMVDLCNLGNTIKDGDLLFTIKLGTKPKETDTSTTDVKFSHNLLSRDFLDSVPYLSDISFKDWLVDDRTMVYEGDDIIEVTEFTSYSSPKFSTTIKAPKTGVLIKKYKNLIKGKLFIGTPLFTIFGEDNNEHTILHCRWSQTYSRQHPRRSHPNDCREPYAGKRRNGKGGGESDQSGESVESRTIKTNHYEQIRILRYSMVWPIRFYRRC